MTDLFEVLAAAPADVNEWTEERINLLTQLRNDGLRRGVIAKKLNELTGARFTKSAVCGKIFRLFPAVKPRKTDEEKAASKLAARKRDAQAKRERRQRFRELNDPNRKAAARVRIDPGPYQCREVEASPRYLALHDLGRDDCRYAYGDDPRTMTFCGQRIAGSHLSFCSVHMLLCTKPRIEKAAA